LEDPILVQFVLALALFAQIEAPHAYTVADADIPEQVDLATDQGLLSMQLGTGCGWVVAGENVALLPGDGSVGALLLPGTNQLCTIILTGQVSDQPCMHNADGVCDVDGDAGE
jgi:hypothetical protein